MNPAPLVKLADAGVAPILNYNVPDPVSYFGSLIVELDLPESYFKTLEATQPELLPENITVENVRQAMLGGFINKQIFPFDATQLRYYEATPGSVELLAFIAGDVPQRVDHILVPSSITPSRRVSEGVTYLEFPYSINAESRLINLAPQEIFDNYRRGLRFEPFREAGRNVWDYRYVGVKPRLAIVEDYRLSSFLGNYGAGKVVHTFTLLPGEKTRISVRTYSKLTSSRNETSSVLDSHTAEAANNLDQAIRSEQSDREETKRQDEWRIEASVSANWGVVSGKASAGYSGSSSSGREQFAKNVSNAVRKSATRASNKRDVQIDQRSQEQVEATNQEGLEREIQNINTGHTLNFVFRQMNQEFITILHLVEARVAFMYGDIPDSLRLVDLPSLDQLLATVVQDAPAPADKDVMRKEVRDTIRGILDNVFDYQDTSQSLIEEVTLGQGPATYLRVRPELVTRVGDRVTVPGIVLSAETNVLRTDGLVVEALVGQGNALDDYSEGLQEEQVRARHLANALQAALVHREQLALELFTAGNAAGAALYAEAYSSSALREGGA